MPVKPDKPVKKVKEVELVPADTKLTKTQIRLKFLEVARTVYSNVALSFKVNSIGMSPEEFRQKLNRVFRFRTRGFIYGEIKGQYVLQVVLNELYNKMEAVERLQP